MILTKRAVYFSVVQWLVHKFLELIIVVRIYALKRSNGLKCGCENKIPNFAGKMRLLTAGKDRYFKMKLKDFIILFIAAVLIYAVWWIIANY